MYGTFGDIVRLRKGRSMISAEVPLLRRHSGKLLLDIENERRVVEPLVFQISGLQKKALIQLSEKTGLKPEKLLKIALNLLISYDFEVIDAVNKGKLCIIPCDQKEKFDSLPTIIDELESLVTEKRKQIKHEKNHSSEIE